MAKFHYKVSGFDPELIAGDQADKRSALLAWADQNGQDASNVLCGLDGGQISVMSEDEYQEWVKDNSDGEMKLFLLTNTVGTHWDWMDALVVRAEDESDARRIASENAKDEGASVWTNPKKSTCTEFNSEGERGVIIEDVHNS